MDAPDIYLKETEYSDEFVQWAVESFRQRNMRKQTVRQMKKNGTEKEGLPPINDVEVC